MGTGVVEELALTWDNVDLVLEELRPYLRSDGGDWKIVGVHGRTVRLVLVQAALLHQ